jgi:hypothetical protein
MVWESGHCTFNMRSMTNLTSPYYPDLHCQTGRKYAAETIYNGISTALITLTLTLTFAVGISKEMKGVRPKLVAPKGST